MITQEEDQNMEEFLRLEQEAQDLADEENDEDKNLLKSQIWELQKELEQKTHEIEQIQKDNDLLRKQIQNSEEYTSQLEKTLQTQQTAIESCLDPEVQQLYVRLKVTEKERDEEKRRSEFLQKTLEEERADFQKQLAILTAPPTPENDISLNYQENLKLQSNQEIAKLKQENSFLRNLLASASHSLSIESLRTSSLLDNATEFSHRVAEASKINERDSFIINTLLEQLKLESPLDILPTIKKLSYKSQKYYEIQTDNTQLRQELILSYQNDFKNFEKREKELLNEIQKLKDDFEVEKKKIAIVEQEKEVLQTQIDGLKIQNERLIVQQTPKKITRRIPMAPLSSNFLSELGKKAQTPIALNNHFTPLFSSD